MAELKRYMLLPRKGFLNESLKELHPEESRGLVESKKPYAPFVVKSKLLGGRDIRVIHSIAADGPKLVELDDFAAREVDRNPEVRRLPVISYAKPLTRLLCASSYPLTAPIVTRGPIGKLLQVTISVNEMKQGRKVKIGSGLVVVALSDFLKRIGVKKSTDDSGEVTLGVPGNTIQRLYCERVWKWGAFRKDVPVSSSIRLELPALSDDFTDCVRSYYGRSRFNPATGVTVGVIDTGVGFHNDLNVISRRNPVGELDDDYADPHGTFVAGIIGSKGELFPKLRGLAPGVPIRSYRVFGGGLAISAGSGAVGIAIDRARLDLCDILNLSIESSEEGAAPKDDHLQEVIEYARDNGMLVVVAAGNDGQDVDYPAAYPGATAVSAMGCQGTFPPGAFEEMTVSEELKGNKDQNEFIATFSNFGKQISVTALGVGVLSTLPGNSFGSCSGTSMAAPVVSGAAASLLSQRPDIYNMPRNRVRSDAIQQLLFDSCITRGFPPEYEGHGMPDPDKV